MEKQAGRRIQSPAWRGGREGGQRESGDSNRGQRGWKGRKKQYMGKTKDIVGTESWPSRREEGAGELQGSHEEQDMGSSGKLGHILRKRQVERTRLPGTTGWRKVRID